MTEETADKPKRTRSGPRSINEKLADMAKTKRAALQKLSQRLSAAEGEVSKLRREHVEAQQELRKLESVLGQAQTDPPDSEPEFLEQAASAE